MAVCMLRDRSKVWRRLVDFARTPHVRPIS